MSWLNILVLSNKESFDIIVLTETFILTNFDFKLPLNFSPVTTFQIFRDSIKYENYIFYFICHLDYNKFSLIYCSIPI